MRRAIIVILVAVTACSEGGQELAPVPSTTTTEAATTTLPSTTSTTVPAATTTTVPPTTTTTLPPLQGLAYEEVARMDFPIQVVGWDEGMSLVATKDGQIYVMEPDGEVRTTPVLDISDQIHNEGERGLLSILSSEDRTQVYVHYSDNNSDTVVSRFTWVDGLLANEEILFEHDQPARNHNGGMLANGPDGIYLGLGDGGGANDAFGNGQNRDTLLGGLVLISPFTGDATLFQYGLRNPWRFWMDNSNGLVYIADVGQNAFEEINVAPLEPDVNYGWPITEALHCFSPSSGCDTAGLTMPVIEVAHGDAGTCSITGGVLYQGLEIPEANGHYFYSDYCGGYLRSFRYENGEAVDQTDWTDQVGVPGNVVSFGTDFFGEIYVLTTNQVLKVTAVR